MSKLLLKGWRVTEREGFLFLKEKGVPVTRLMEVTVGMGVLLERRRMSQLGERDIIGGEEREREGGFVQVEERVLARRSRGLGGGGEGARIIVRAMTRKKSSYFWIWVGQSMRRRLGEVQAKTLAGHELGQDYQCRMPQW